MKRILLPIALILMFALTGCESTNAKTEGFNIETARIGAMTGSTGELFAIDAYPDAQIESFGSIMDAVAALKAGRVDAVITADVTCRNIERENDDIERVPTLLTNEHISIGIKKGNDELLSNINRIIAELHEDGTLDDMAQRWIENFPSVSADVPETDGEVLRVGTDPTRVPISYLDENSANQGFAPELARRIGLALGRRIEFVSMDFASLIPALESGKIDCIIDLMTATEERKKSINFSETYYTSGQNILKRADGAQTAALTYEDFVDTGKTIAVQTGEMYGDVARDSLHATVVEYTTAVDILESLKSGRVDAALMGSAYVRPLIDSGTYPEFDYLWIPKEVFVDERAPVFHSEELRDKYNEWLNIASADGTLEEMVSRWMGGSLPAEEDIPRFVLTGENGTLNVCDTGDYPPYVYFDSNNEPVGFDYELVSRFAEYMGMKLEWSMMSYGSILSAVSSGKSDMSACVYTVTDEREQGLIFGDPCVSLQGVLVIPKPDGTTGNADRTLIPGDYSGKTFAVVTGSIWDEILEEQIPGAIPMYYNSVADTLSALQTGKVDATFTNSALLPKFSILYPDLQTLKPEIFAFDCAFVFGKESTELRESFNDFLNEIHTNGTYDDMLSYWLGTAAMPDMPDIPLTGENGKLTFATSGANDVFSFIQNGQAAGFEVELALRFAQHKGMELEIIQMDWGALITAVQSGKADFAADGFAVTEERKAFVDFSDTVFIDGLLVAVPKADNNALVKTVSFLEGIKQSFTQNLITENRWKMIVDGLVISIIITIFAFALATLLGFGVCGLRMSKNPILRVIAGIYINVLRGTPVLVLLMITFYIIFAKSSISGTVVAIIAFGANGAAFIGEIIRSAILTVDKGQVEAARSMGFSKVGAFFTVTLPQAVRVAFPVYKSEFISMFKMTSVVGYIAIVDLTKAGDIIRSRTYDAFFPLIFVALVYLAAASLMIFLFDRIDKATDKRYKLKKCKTKLTFSARELGISPAAAVISGLGVGDAGVKVEEKEGK